ncbi:hypothetical protein [Streptomyces tendae]|uniref:hypothetical protein n=1 Tax=Streptomyces tendae TaxID=1932 RepID=UPI002492B8FB|nr:hypothetical protein [Streptomyces tendae]
MRRQNRDQDQALAAVLAALLLVGGTLIVRELLGLWPAAAVGMAPALALYGVPPAARRIAVAVEVHRFRRRLAHHNRAAG